MVQEAGRKITHPSFSLVHAFGMAALLIAAGITALVLVLAWWYLFQPAVEAQQQQCPAPQTVHAPIERQDEAHLAEQRAFCQAVKDQSLAAARLLRLHGTSTEKGAEPLLAALVTLTEVMNDNLDGPRGVLGTTELCNALVEADALETLDALQRHADQGVATHSAALFQHVIPRIWSF